MDIIKQEYEDYWNVSEVEREICREKFPDNPEQEASCYCRALDGWLPFLQHLEVLP